MILYPHGIACINQGSVNIRDIYIVVTSLIECLWIDPTCYCVEFEETIGTHLIDESMSLKVESFPRVIFASCFFDIEIFKGLFHLDYVN
jgi:hypothetical protein